MGDLRGLMDKRDALKRDEIAKAIIKSSRSHDEILRFITSDRDEE
jgi:hypothetical protein